MNTWRFKNYSVSQLVLGTAQFGLEYGIANQLGQPSYKEVLQIVEMAFQAGVNAFDTAAMYGESEKVIGQALGDLKLHDRAFLITKVPWIRVENKGQAVRRFLEKSLANSLQNLGIDSLPLCLLHRAIDLPYLDVLLDLREKGWVEHVGISVSTPQQALEALETPGIAAIEHPTSVLDQRFVKAGVLQEAKKRGIAIIARSIYLQGLLFLRDEELPVEFGLVMDARRRLEKLAEPGSITDLALAFVRSLEGINGIVVGLETREQLESNLALFEKDPLDRVKVEELYSIVPDLPEHLLDPSQWPCKKSYVWNSS